MKTIRTWLAVLCLTGVALAQTAAPDKEKPAGKKSELETMLEEAFKNNPDLRVAEAKFAEAQAELARVRLMLVQKVAKAAADLRAAQMMEEESKRRWLRDVDLSRKGTGVISTEDLNLSRVTYMRYKGEAEAAEAALNALLGKVSERDKSMLGEYYKRLSLDLTAERYGVKGPLKTAASPERDVPSGPMVDNLRKALGVKVNIDWSDTDPKDRKLGVLLDEVEKRVGVKFLGLREMGRVHQLEVPFFTKIEDQTVGAVLTFLEDHVGGEDLKIVFLVREYGLSPVLKDKAPPGAITLKEFRKLTPPASKDETPATKPAEKKTAAPIEGQVMKVDGPLMTLNIGADAGLAKGMELQAYRLGATPKYLGKVKVVEVTPTNAVAQVVGKALDAMKEGDKVATRLLDE